MQPSIELSDQIAIVVSLFGGIAGIAVTVVGLVIAGYTLRRGSLKKEITGKEKRILDLMTYAYCLILSTILWSMSIIAFALEGSFVKDKLFVMSTWVPIHLFVYITTIILNVMTIWKLRKTQKQEIREYEEELNKMEPLKREKYKVNHPVRSFNFEVFISRSIVIFTSLLLVVTLLVNDKSLSMIAMLCFIQIVFGIMQIWGLIKK